MGRAAAARASRVCLGIGRVSGVLVAVAEVVLGGQALQLDLDPQEDPLEAAQYLEHGHQ